MRDVPRPRRPVSAVTLKLVRPLFRFSPGRDAFVLRVAGGRYGPVLVERDSRPAPSMRTGRFDRTSAPVTDADEIRAKR